MTKEIIDNNDPYKSAGVDIEAGNNLVDKIKDDVASSHGPNVLGNIGGFAGMFKLDKDYENPVLVACTDGVGTKVALAQETKNLSYIGQDLVAMCVNDLIVCGAKPLFFLDYFASSKLDVEEAAVIIKSISKACRDSGCALLGGETAEMPGHYVGNNFDLAGFSVGCVDEKNILTNKLIDSGNILIGIESSGPHSNGFSLIRKIISESNLNNEEFNKITQMALKPTHLYPSLIMKILADHNINGMAHITGGGLTENIPRSIPEDFSVTINKNAWEMPEIFSWLQEKGNLKEEDMYRVFNCGIGMVLIVNRDDVDSIQKDISDYGYKNFLIGEVVEKNTDYPVKYL
jgi:phosphoribosylformylglycinamidine cyclo-ligase